MKYYAVLKYNSEYCTNDIIAVKNTQEEAKEFLKTEAKSRLKTLCDLKDEEIERQWKDAEMGEFGGDIILSDNETSAYVYYDCYREYLSVSEFEIGEEIERL